MGDVIDRDGFRANVGIVLMQRRAASCSSAGARAAAAGSSRRAACARARSSSSRCSASCSEEIGLGRGDVDDHRPDPALAALPAAGALRAARWPAAVRRAEAALVPAAPRARGREHPLRHHRRTRIRPWRWVDYWQPVREVIYFKRAVYTRALHELGLQAFPGGLPPYPEWWHRASRRHRQPSRTPTQRRGLKLVLQDRASTRPPGSALNIPGKLVVRTHAPARRWLVLLVLALLSALWRCTWPTSSATSRPGSTASRPRSSARRCRARSSPGPSLQELRVQLAAADAAADGAGARAQRSRAHHRRAAGRCCARSSRNWSSIAVSRCRRARQAASVRVQQFQVLTRDAATRQYTLRFSAQPPGAAGGVRLPGTLGVMVDGERNGAAASVDLGVLTGGKASLSCPYNFRYFANVEQPITLPAGFQAAARDGRSSTWPQGRGALPPDLRVDSRGR